MRAMVVVVRMRLVAVALKLAVTLWPAVVLKTAFAVCGPDVVGENAKACVQVEPLAITSPEVQVGVPFDLKAALPVSAYVGVESVAETSPTLPSVSVTGRLVRLIFVVAKVLAFNAKLYPAAELAEESATNTLPLGPTLTSAGVVSPVIRFVAVVVPAGTNWMLPVVLLAR